MKEYFKIIKLKSELSKSPLVLPYGINSFFTFKPSKITLAQFICITCSIQLFGQFLTSPYTRACHQTNSSKGGFVQTNSSEGGFVRKVPSTFFFLFFYYFSFIIFFSVLTLFPFFPLSFSWWSLDIFRVTRITEGRGESVLGYLIGRKMIIYFCVK